jgi:hypothetical protein
MTILQLPNLWMATKMMAGKGCERKTSWPVLKHRSSFCLVGMKSQ